LKEGRILLFVNKKKQKNFFHWTGTGQHTGSQTDKVFYASFFFRKKKNFP